MTTMVLHSGRFAGRFWPLFGFAHHGKAWRRRPLPAFAPAGRFSARFGRRSRCAKLIQNAGHDATNLPRRDGTLFAFPRMVESQAELFSQQQVIAGASHNPGGPGLLPEGPRCFPEITRQNERNRDHFARDTAPRRHHSPWRSQPDAERTAMSDRGRRLPYYLGRAALEKSQIGLEFLERTKECGLRLDIAIEEKYSSDRTMSHSMKGSLA